MTNDSFHVLGSCLSIESCEMREEGIPAMPVRATCAKLPQAITQRTVATGTQTSHSKA